MKSRAIRRLARKLRATHQKTRSWQKTAQIHNITNADGQVSKGLAYQIAVNNFEPKEHDTLLRLQLPCYCEKCERVRRYEKRMQHVTLYDMSREELLYALQHRKPINVGYTKKAMSDFIRACKGRAP